jgi:hypothetical protein
MEELMIKINKEQNVAGSLQIVNDIIGVIAFIPAVLCWLCTLLFFTEFNDEHLIFFLSSSALLIVFYGYTIWSPRIYLFESYDMNTSFVYWIIVILTNLLTGFLFVIISCWQMAIVPAIPFLFAVYGLIMHLKLK